MKVSNFTALCSVLLLIWVVIIQLIWLPSIFSDYPEEAIKYLGESLFYPVGFFLVGLNLDSIYNCFKKQKILRLIIRFLYFLYVITIIAGVLVALKVPGHAFGIFQNPFADPNYLTFSDSFAVFSFFVGALEEKEERKLAVFLLSGMLLFLTQSRSTFLFYWLTLFFLLYGIAKQKPILTVGILVTVVTAVIVGLFILGKPLSESRVVNLITNPLADKSAQKRMWQFSEGFQRLSGHWLLGHFMAEVTEGIGAGTYLHNWFSFLESYGVGPFLYSIFLLVLLLFGSIKVLFVVPTGGVNLFIATMGIFSFFSIAIARSYIWPYVWVPIGGFSFIWSLESLKRCENPVI